MTHKEYMREYMRKYRQRQTYKDWRETYKYIQAAKAREWRVSHPDYYKQRPRRKPQAKIETLPSMPATIRYDQ